MSDLPCLGTHIKLKVDPKKGNKNNKQTLAAHGLEEPQNSQELLIESVGPVSFVLCFVSHRSHLLFLHGVEVSQHTHLETIMQQLQVQTTQLNSVLIYFVLILIY